MQAVILAAGRGKRMGKLTQDTAKPMLRIKGKPILEHKFNALPRKIKEVVLVVGYQSMGIISHFKHCYGGRKITYVFQDNISLGTGGSIHLAKSILREKFLVMMGDDLYCKKDLENILKHDLAVLGYEVEDPSSFGVIRTNQRGNMVDIIEKPKNRKYRFANTGAYVLNRNFFDYELVPARVGDVELGLPQTLAQMAGKHQIKVEKATDWHPIGNPDDLARAAKILHKFI